MRKLFLLLILVGAVAWGLYNRGGVATGGTVPPVAAAPPPERPGDKIEIANISWSRSGFGTVAIASFALVNNHAFAVKDVRLLCSFEGKSGTVIDTKRTTVFELLPAGKSVKVREFNFGFINGQAARAGCNVTGADKA